MTMRFTFGLGYLARGIGRLFGAIFGRSGQAASDAANEVFTSSPDGVRAGFGIVREQLKDRIQRRSEAAGRLIASVNKETARRDRLAAQLLELRGDAAAAVEEYLDAEKKGDTQEMGEWKAEHESCEREAAQVESDLKASEERLVGATEDVTRAKAGLSELKRQKEELSGEEARSVERLLAGQDFLALESELDSAQEGIDASPVNAIREKLAQLEGQVQVARELSDTDVTERRSKLRERRETMKTDTAFTSAIQAARARREGVAADSAAATGAGPVKTDTAPKLTNAGNGENN